jgi:hypothetical protein
MGLPEKFFENHHQNQNCLQKCFYMMNLIRHKSVELWEMYAPVYENLKVEESWEFYNLLVDEYKKLLESAPVIKKRKVTTKRKKTVSKKKK